MATITLANIQQYAQIPTNIEGRLIDFQISKSRTLDVEPTVTKALMTAVDAAVASTGTKPELEAFYNNFIVPYWCHSAYHRFMSSHGTNVTQFGVTVTNDPRGTFNQASTEQRAIILREIYDDKKVYRQFMIDRLKEVNFTFDGVSFSESKTIDARVSYINPIRKKEVRPFGNSINRFLD